MTRLRGAVCLAIGALETDRLCELVRRESIDLVVIGPEAPLHAGLADALNAQVGDRVSVFGCSAAASEIEASKVFAKAFMIRHGIPTAAHTVVQSKAEAADFLARHISAQHGWVVKADGLRAGKGVTLCQGPAETLNALLPLLHSDGQAIIEERLQGRETSLMALCDGEHFVVLPPCEDHKTLCDEDFGPMTGGMGAICPTPPAVFDDTALAQVRQQILLPAARGLVREGRPFHGLLYAGLMLTPQGPKVLEFNCRFGDPETQALMMVLDDDLLPWLDAVGRRRLAQIASPLETRGAAASVVMAAAGYPGPPVTGTPIHGLDAAEALAPDQVMVFHAGTALNRAGHLTTSGGRVLGITARAADLLAARQLAYRAAALVHFDGAQMRTDIGAR